MISAFVSIERNNWSSNLLVRLHKESAVEQMPINSLVLHPLPSDCLVQDNLPAAFLATGILPWLTETLLPALQQGGVVRWLWISAATQHGHYLAEQVAKRLPHLVILRFNDVEQAASWLIQQHKPLFI